MHLRHLVFAAATFAFAATGALAEPFAVISKSQAKQPGAEEYVLHSQRVGRDFLIEVTTPFGPLVKPGQKLPVIYALDGGYGVAGPLSRVMAATSSMSPALFVAVGYKPSDYARRPTDLLHRPWTRDGETQGGGGAAFEAFLLEELKPYIEANYPADATQAALFGHSMGGLFATNVLVRRPDAFAAYVIASPFLESDPAALDGARRARGPQRIYVSVGATESKSQLDAAAQISAALARPGSGFAVTTRVFEGEGHVSYYPALVLDAFPAILPPPPGPKF
jgi:predicted alpha/beta superfamily hydrolase